MNDDEQRTGLQEAPRSESEERPRSFRWLIAVFLPAPVVTHVAAMVALERYGIELDPLGMALLIGSTVTIFTLLVAMWLFIPRR